MMKNNNKQYSYMDSVHRDGRIWNLSVMVILMAFPLVVGVLFSAMPDWEGVGKGLLATAPMYWAVGVIETITYIPMLGAGGSYLSFVTGNISNLKLPCALNALENADIALPAVQDHFFIQNGKSFKLLCSPDTNARLKTHLDIEPNRDLIKAPIEGHVVDVNVCAEDLRAFGADRGSAFQ